MVALSGIHELFLGNKGLVEDLLLEVSVHCVQRTNVTASAIESTLEFGFQMKKPASRIYRCEPEVFAWIVLCSALTLYSPSDGAPLRDRS